jgi:hypothetical protein
MHHVKHTQAGIVNAQNLFIACSFNDNEPPSSINRFTAGSDQVLPMGTIDRFPLVSAAVQHAIVSITYVSGTLLSAKPSNDE